MNCTHGETFSIIIRCIFLLETILEPTTPHTSMSKQLTHPTMPRALIHEKYIFPRKSKGLSSFVLLACNF